MEIKRLSNGEFEPYLCLDDPIRPKHTNTIPMRVVEAAPELLAACKTALAHCKLDGPVGATPDTAKLIAKDLEQAIAKAEGRE